MGEGRALFQSFIVSVIFFFLEQLQKSFLMLVEVVLGKNYLFHHFFLSNLRFGPSTPWFNSICFLFDDIELECLLVFLLPFFIPLHKVEDIDGIHVKVRKILWSFDLVIDMCVHLFSFGLASAQKGVNLFLTYCVFAGFEDSVGSKLQNLFHLIVGDCFVFLGGSLLLDDETVPFEFDHLPLYDLFLDCILGDESVDFDEFGLANAVGSVHSLEIHLRVKITIIEYNSIGCCQIDAQSSCSRAE